MKRVLLLCSSIFQLSICAFSQTSSGATFKNVIGPSPNAAAIEKYVNIPVSNYTGVPNIEIPIYTIINKDLALPINLSYHAGGIRVDEEASRVGLGWVLTAPSVISRTVNGNDDFAASVGYLANSFPEFYGADVSQILKVSSANVIATDNTNLCKRYILGSSYDFVNYVPVDGIDEKFQPDLEPDVFCYNIPGYAGKFVVRKNRQIVKEKPDAIKIELIETPTIKFQVIDPNGTKYIFDQTEHCVFSSSSGTTDNITSWYLSKIVSVTGAEINLHYTSVGIGVRTLTTLNTKYSMFTNALSEYECGSIIGISSYYPPVKEYPLVYLDSITYPFGSVSFAYDDRIDIKYDKRLIKVSVNNHYNPGKSFSYNLIQDYFTTNYATNGIPDPELNMDQNLFDKRLKLTKLELLDASNKEVKNYQFTYNEQNLPSKKSFARDHWGFFNGQGSNSTFLPNISFPHPFIPGQTESYANGANRAPASNYNQAFVLKQIKYPTGGTTSFEYETNDYNEYKSIAGPADPGVELIEETKEFLTRRGFDETFTITFPQVLPNSKIAFEIVSENGQQTTWPYPLSDDAYLEIYPEGSSTYIQRSLLGLESFWQSLGNYSYKRTDQFDIPAGTYTIKTHVASNVSFLNYIRFKFTYSYYKTATVDDAPKLAGGLRVAKISETDPVSGKINVRKFQYGFQADKDQNGTPEYYSYGRRMSKLQYTNHELIVKCVVDEDGILDAAPCDIFNLFSSGIIPLEGPIVGYDTTITLYGEAGQNGKEEFYYENQPALNLPYIYTYPPYTYEMNIRPSGVRDLVNLNNGNLKKKATFRFNRNTSQFEKLTESEYNYISAPEETFLGIRKVFKDVCQSDAGNCAWRFVQYPVFQSSWTRMGQEVTREYSPGTANVAVETIKKYKYESDNPIHYQPIEIQSTTSKGYKKYQYTTYPSDYAAGTGFIDNMISLNVLQPIENVIIKEQSGNKYVLSGKLTSYKDVLPLPDHVLSTEFGAPVPLSGFKFSNRTAGELPTAGGKTAFQPDLGYKEVMSFDQYDESRNLVEQTKTDDLKKSYIWDYQNNYPICEVVNAPVSEIAYTSFEADGSGNWTINSTNRISNNGITGSKCYDLSNGSVKRLGLTSTNQYILSYWSTNSTPFIINGSHGTPVKGRSVGQWTYFEHRISDVTEVDLPQTSSFIDELRLYPLGAQITSYTYIPLIGITSQCDAGNRIVYYDYDILGRLQFIFDQDHNIVRKICYNYAGQPGNCELFSSVVKTGVFTRNCGTGAGSSVTYTVNAGAYKSTISQADADQQAQDDVNTNGQAYADSHGSCTFSSVAKSGVFTRSCTEGTGSNVTYTVNAGTYTSAISQADADQQAQNDVNVNGQAYADSHGTCTFSSAAKSGVFICSCGTGTGSSVTYTVNAGTYTSTISQADADQQAQNDVNANGQAYANSHGTCTYYSVAKSGVFSRSCTLGTGSSVTYTVNAGAYTSAISQADADQQAQNDVNANGQAYANAHGTCPPVYYNDDRSGTYYATGCTPPEEPNAWYVSVPAGMFTSLISKEDANNQADIYAQTDANNNGGCSIPLIDLTYTNGASYEQFNITLHNTITGQDYWFSTTINGSSGFLGQVPAGTYDISIGPAMNPAAYSYTVGCYYYTYDYNAFFYSVPVDESCSFIDIY